jgi:hypothetical protein
MTAVLLELQQSGSCSDRGKANRSKGGLVRATGCCLKLVDNFRRSNHSRMNGVNGSFSVTKGIRRHD